MTWLEAFLKQVDAYPDRIALWAPGQPSVTFIELKRMAASAQELLKKEGVSAGDRVLIMDRPGPRLYAALIATLAQGGSALLLEPWISMGRMEEAIQSLQPKAFFASTLGKVFGLRIGAIRAIPIKLNPRAIQTDVRGSALEVRSVDATAPALTTFTSSSDEPARPVIRTQRALVAQMQALAAARGIEAGDAPDLCIFSNSALSNLAVGRTSLLFPQRWTKRVMRWMQALPPSLSPASMQCSPGFLAELMAHAPPQTLRKVILSRAIADCTLLEKAFESWPDAQFLSIYGSSETEPLAAIDARLSVKLSRERGFLQALALGHACPGVESRISPEKGLEVRAAHTPAPTLTEWTQTKDRVSDSSAGWWYEGRISQPSAEFELEQRVYRLLGHTHAFVQRGPDGKLYLLGEKVESETATIRARFPEIEEVIEANIARDKRHHSWINRRRTLRERLGWSKDPSKDPEVKN